MVVKFLLSCPECGKSETLTVESKYGNYDYPCILNCPRCGKFEIDKLEGLKQQ